MVAELGEGARILWNERGEGNPNRCIGCPFDLMTEIIARGGCWNPSEAIVWYIFRISSGDKFAAPSKIDG